MTQSSTLFVVPAERHVERLARGGERAETRSGLRTRLAAALLPDVRFADAREVRLRLGIAIEESRGKQLDLFGGGAAQDPLLAQLRGPSWVRAVGAIDEALGALRARGVTETQLDRAAKGAGVAAARARTLAGAMRAVDRALAPARDARLMGPDLAVAIRQAPRAKLLDALGATALRSRWILHWDPQDLAWWRALDEALGDVRVVLPWFDKRLEGSRERDPLEVVADGVLKYLEAAPETEMIPAVLGDLASVAPGAADVQNVQVGRAKDAAEQARLVARTIKERLRGAARVERIAIAYPTRDERTLRPLRQALGEEGIVFHDALGAPPKDVPVVAAALQALQAAETKDRIAVARLLRSGYVDAPRALGQPEMTFRDAERVLERLAKRLETRATAVGETPVERLIATAAGDARRADAASTDLEHARRIASLLTTEGRTRLERLHAARAIFAELGLAARAGRGALSTFARDEAPSGVDRAERLAVARDVRAWEVLEDALDAYEAAAADARQPVDAEMFLLELGDLLDASAMLPGAGRAGAVRLVRLADVAGDELDMLVVVDANNGVLPRDQRPVSLVTESLEERVKMGSGGERAARDLAALAVAAAEAKLVVLVTTAADDGDAPAQPARVVVAALRAGAAVLDVPAAERKTGQGEDVGRRAERERAREAFFLDPRRTESPLAGTLAPSATVASVVTPETGGMRERPLAVTSIERFAQCPFKGYAHAILAAREGEEQRELPDAREEGNLGHEALAAAFLATRVEWALRPRDAERVMAKGLAAAEEALAKSAGHAPLRAIVRLRVRESVRAVLTRALEDETWDFALAEQAFGREKPWPEFDVRAASGGELWLRGSVDRIDRAHDGSSVRVIDYKRSKSTVQSSMQSLGEAAIQVPLYAAVARRNLSLPATGAYLPTQPRDLAAPSPRPKEDRVAELAAGSPSEIEERVAALATAARAGRFAPLPVRESECTFCSVSGGCRKPRFAMEPVEDQDLDKEGV